MAKKEKTLIDVIMDILTKIKSVYSKDLYIKDSTYIFPGNESEDSLSGKTICEFHPEYIPYIKTFFDNKPVIYIPNVTEFKNEMKEVLESVDSFNSINDLQSDSVYKWYSKEMPIYKELLDKEKEIESSILSDDTFWLKLSDIEEVAWSVIFNDNETLTINPKDHSPMIVGKKTFPLLSDKNIDDLYISFGKSSVDKKMNTAISRLQHKYFTVISLFYYLDIES
jgi:hypothetical protein